MSFAPLLDAAPAIPLHAFAAMAAFVLGLVQFAAPKGTLPHRTIGWIWVALMAFVAVSSFCIHQIRLVGPWSPIHLLSIFTPIMLVVGVLAARGHNVRRHKITMISIFAGAPAGRRAVHPGAGTDHAYRHFRQLARDEIRLGPFSSPAPDAAQQECCEPGSALLCMGLFSRFFVQALPCTAEGTLLPGPGHQIVML
jgi:uncharacterized membrane protein